MKKIIYLIFILLAYSNLTFAQSNDADKLLGTWLVGSGKAHIKITKYGDKYQGKIAWLKEPKNEKGENKVDKNNPDASKRNTPLLGLTNMIGFKYTGNNQWQNGTIYDAESGKTYSCNIKLTNPQTLEVRGFVGVSLFGRTDTWKRIGN
jgi:uncharacterized protein (DUF2147 family)